ncbi:odorant receptor 131-2-like [Amia ocellicauda]|uniref:odorant receptor 131-2-like n=1 Tax=Amia ocellicauda TaxID=2972642 RepID=UPI003464AB4D
MSCILIILALASIPSLINIMIFMSSVPLCFYTQLHFCNAEMLIRHQWQAYLRSSPSQLYFLFMTIIIAFTYVKVWAAAKAASMDNTKSMSKGHRTVILHAVQLLLCLIEMWCPFIETAVYEIDMNLFIHLRYFDYIAFILAPQCLNPLVNGLRNETFFLVLKDYTD